MGWEVPAPAWNRSGFFLFLVVLSLLLRSLGGGVFRWAIRLTLIPAAYYWWGSKEALQTWGVKTFGPIQLKFSSVNVALSHLGVEPVELFVARRWKELEPQFGWYLAGVVLALTLVGTLLDQPDLTRCLDCGSGVDDRDRFCGKCGGSLVPSRLCSECAEEIVEGDGFCRRCGAECSKNGEAVK